MIIIYYYYIVYFYSSYYIYKNDFPLHYFIFCWILFDNSQPKLCNATQSSHRFFESSNLS